MNAIDVLNLASNSSVSQNKILEKLMYLMWYEHMKDKYQLGPNGIYKHINYETLANKYYEEFDEKIKCWDIPTRGIGEFV